MTLLAGSLQNCISDYLQNSVVHLTDAFSISTYTANLERLCNLHYRLLDGCYTVAYKDNCGNCPQFISLLIYLNFSSIYKSCDFFWTDF